MSHKNSLAIAYSLKNRKHKMAEGGQVEEEKKDHHAESIRKRDELGAMLNKNDMLQKWLDKKKDKEGKRERAIRMFEGGSVEEKPNSRAMDEEEHKLGQHGDDEVGPEGPHIDAEELDHKFSHDVENQSEGMEEDMVGRIMKQRGHVFAEGGEVHKSHKKYSEALRAAPDRDAVRKAGNDHNKNMREMGADRKEYVDVGKKNERRGFNKFLAQDEGFAEGGMAENSNAHMCSGADCSHMSHGGMAKHHYSEGGKVSNSDLPIADDMSAEYDDLHLRDDLESSYTGKNSGDELGNAQEDSDREDIISRIMASRRKKDRMPRPA